jgi:hypothetical protein
MVSQNNIILQRRNNTAAGGSILGIHQNSHLMKHHALEQLQYQRLPGRRAGRDPIQNGKALPCQQQVAAYLRELDAQVLGHLNWYLFDTGRYVYDI